MFISTSYDTCLERVDNSIGKIKKMDLILTYGDNVLDLLCMEGCMKCLRRPLVLAGNYNQFLNWLSEHKLSKHDFVYITGRESFIGCHGVKVLRIGTWWENDLSNSPELRHVEETL